MWTEWPNRQVTGVVKGYMLFQLAFWLQQVLVINIEERRKDHWQMLTHHIITIALISASYRYGHTRVGTVILVLMDIGDLVFGVGCSRLPFADCPTNTHNRSPNASSTPATTRSVTPPSACSCLHGSSAAISATTWCHTRYGHIHRIS
jgi:hypothetical protein